LNLKQSKPWLSRVIGKLNGALHAAFKPNMTLPGIFGVIVFLGADKAAFVNQSERVLGSGIPSAQLVTPALMGLYAYLSLLVFTQLRMKFKDFGNAGLSFFVATFLSSALNVIFIEVTLGPNINLALSNGVRIFIGTVIISILVGQYRQWVSRELFKNMGLLASIKQQRKLLIQADEDARRDIASLLHDGVQSKLVVSATKLHQISSKAPPALALELQELLLELEGIRSLDVRSASRSLSPDIDIMGLDQCLRDLANVYSGTMATSFDLRGITNIVESEAGLAIYRICEQALLNALTHGAANACLVTLWFEENTVYLEIENNGSRLSTSSNPSQGSAVIDAWVSTFDGIWSLADISKTTNSAKLLGGTVRLSAELKLPALAIHES
jgi:signal transduction histidine kinase